MLNYYLPDSTWKLLSEGSRRAARWVLGYRPVDYRGLLDGSQARRVDRLFVSRAEFVPAAERFGKVIEIPMFATSSETALVGQVILIDQPLASMAVSEFTQREAARQMLALLQDLGRPVYIKKHPTQQNPSIDFPFAGELPKAQAIESMVPGFRDCVYVTYLSSALLTLRLLDRDSTVYAVARLLFKELGDSAIPLSGFCERTGIKLV